MSGNPRIVVITNGNYFARLILDNVFNQERENIVGILVITGDYKGRTGVRALWELGKVTALPYIVYKVFSIVLFRAAKIIFRKALFSVSDLAKLYHLSYEEMVSIKSEEAIEWVVNRRPDLVISVSCPQMIGKKILNSGKYGGINIHSSLLPSYAGLAPYYWVLSRGEKTTGTTVHYMTLKFDEGNILEQKEIPIDERESAFHLFYRLALTGNEILQNAVEKVFNGDRGYPQEMSKYSYFSNPTFESYLELRRKGHCLLRFGEIMSVIRDEIRREKEYNNFR